MKRDFLMRCECRICGAQDLDGDFAERMMEEGYTPPFKADEILEHEEYLKDISWFQTGVGAWAICYNCFGHVQHFVMALCKKDGRYDETKEYPFCYDVRPDDLIAYLAWMLADPDKRTPAAFVLAQYKKDSVLTIRLDDPPPQWAVSAKRPAAPLRTGKGLKYG